MENSSDLMPSEVLQNISKDYDIPISSKEFAEFMDEKDKISHLRQEFTFPLMKNFDKVDLELVKGQDECIYMCGNSLGLQPKLTPSNVSQALQDWTNEILTEEEYSIVSRVRQEEQELIPNMAKIVGAKENEISIMNGLTVNLHLLMISFYQPTKDRHKILIESKAFPSDHYAAESQIRFRGYEPETSLIAMKPREGEECLRTEDIIDLIEREGDSIAVVLFPGIQYYTGQLFDMKIITDIAHRKGCWVGFDLAHAVGNVELHLHDWGVDFASWCTYKYLNSGPGSVGCGFLHEKLNNRRFKKFLGPARNQQQLLDPEEIFNTKEGIKNYQISQPSTIILKCLKSSLDIFAKTSMKELNEKSFLLTGYLEFLILKYFKAENDSKKLSVKIITPASPKERGVQLSLVFSHPISEVSKELQRRGIVCDVRKPFVIRVAPAPIYCKFLDVYNFVESVRECANAFSNLI